MNIFVVDTDPVIAAQSLHDVHVNKMTTETGQMLSTAHRVLDGRETRLPDRRGRMLKRWVFDDERDELFYKDSNPNHPCNKWLRETTGNYEWLYRHFEALAKEFEYRYGKIHGTWDKLGSILRQSPKNLSVAVQTEFFRATGQPNMASDPVTAYRSYYRTEKLSWTVRGKVVHAKWTGRNRPSWLEE